MPPHSKDAASISGSATPTVPATVLPSANSGSLESEVRNLRTVVAQQSRQISNMALTMDVLKSEIMSLKEKESPMTL